MGQPKTDSSGQIQRRTESVNLASFLQNNLADQIQIAVPKHLSPDRMVRIALTAIRTTPKLALCDQHSFAAAVMNAAALGLEVNTPLGHAYLIPRLMKQRDGSKRMECTLQIGYQGMIDLARRSGQVSSIYAFTVHEGDEFAYRLGLDPDVTHVPNLDVARHAGNMTHVYAVAKLRGEEGDRQFVVLSKRDVEERKARGVGGPAWRTDYLAMARKTAVRALFTMLPKSPEMARASTVDDAETGVISSRRALDPLLDEQLVEAGVLPPDADEPIDTTGEDVDESTGEA